MPNPITKRQAEILEFVRLFSEKRGYPPTRQEIADAFDFVSPNAAQQHLVALKVKGYVNVIEGISRGISLTERGKRHRFVLKVA